MTLNILTPEWSRSSEADSVFIPGTLGEFEILRNHAPIISTMTEGKVKWTENGKLETLEVKGGVIRLKDNVINICAEV